MTGSRVANFVRLMLFLFPGICWLPACGSSPSAEPVTLRPPPSDRTTHVRHLLRHLDGEGRMAPFDFLGRRLTSAGAAAVVVELGLRFLPACEETDRGLRALLEATADGKPLPTLDAALVLRALVPAAGDRPVPARMRKLVAAILASRRHDGGWGDPVTTAWAALALREATGARKYLDDLAGQDWSPAAEAYFRELPADSLSPLERIHAAAGLGLVSSGRVGMALPPADQARIRALLAGIPVDGDADLVLARAFDWIALTPGLDPDHPERPAKEAFRARYESGTLTAASPGEEAKLVLALEWFGYDDFGAAMGYLMVGDVWSQERGTTGRKPR